MQLQWFKKNPDLLQRNITLVKQCYPSFELKSDIQTGCLYWIGFLTFTSDFGRTYKFRIRSVYPPNYPDRLPIVYDEGKVFVPCLERHILPDHSFCLTLPDRKEFELTTNDTIVDFFEVVRGFLEKQVIYDLIGKWPGIAEPHGSKAIAKYYLERELGIDDNFPGKESMINYLLSKARCGPDHLCPCESNRKYKKCHKYLLDRLWVKIHSRLHNI